MTIACRLAQDCSHAQDYLLVDETSTVYLNSQLQHGKLYLIKISNSRGYEFVHYVHNKFALNNEKGNQVLSRISRGIHGSGARFFPAGSTLEFREDAQNSSTHSNFSACASSEIYGASTHCSRDTVRYNNPYEKDRETYTKYKEVAKKQDGWKLGGIFAKKIIDPYNPCKVIKTRLDRVTFTERMLQLLSDDLCEIQQTCIECKNNEGFWSGVITGIFGAVKSVVEFILNIIFGIIGFVFKCALKKIFFYIFKLLLFIQKSYHRFIGAIDCFCPPIAIIIEFIGNIVTLIFTIIIRLLCFIIESFAFKTLDGVINILTSIINKFKTINIEKIKGNVQYSLCC